ncbi:MAG TPA: CDP-diacylglycerol--serine O-phosphatidyltransferase [Candidatus Binatia bacterium]
MTDEGEPTLPARSSATPIRKGVYILPNLITTAGLFAGFYSVIATFRPDFERAAIAILVANIFDILDGRIARLTHSTTRFGIEYDSLADLVAFGVAPGILVYRWALEPWGNWGWLAASLYVACGALRLARFNVQYENAEKRHFVGLPIPAAAELISSIVLLYYYLGGEGPTRGHLVLLLVTYALAGLMVSNLKYFSFKETDLYRRQPFWMLIAIIVLLKLFIAEPQIMLFASFFLYASSGPFRWVFVRGRRLRTQMRRRGRPGDAGPVAPASGHRSDESPAGTPKAARPVGLVGGRWRKTAP